MGRKTTTGEEKRRKVAEKFSRLDIYRVTQLLLKDGLSGSQAADAMRERYEVKMSREEPHICLVDALARGILTIHPSVVRQYSDEISNSLGIGGDRIHVIEPGSDPALEAVAVDVAERVIKRIHEVAATKSKNAPVRIGLGSGATMRIVAQRLAKRLRREASLPDLDLHALSSGFSNDNPATASSTYFGFFWDIPTTVKNIPLFAPPVVSAKQFAQIQKSENFQRAAAAAKKIDIMITSFASATDENSELRRTFRTRNNLANEKRLNNAGWIGDVHYQPYSASGPLELGGSAHPVSLFTIEELREWLARKNRHSILVAGPCADPEGRAASRTSRADALAPLLANRDLRIWSECSMDVGTAKEVVELLKPVALGGEG